MQLILLKPPHDLRDYAYQQPGSPAETPNFPIHCLEAEELCKAQEKLRFVPGEMLAISPSLLDTHGYRKNNKKQRRDLDKKGHGDGQDPLDATA